MEQSMRTTDPFIFQPTSMSHLLSTNIVKDGCAHHGRSAKLALGCSKERMRCKERCDRQLEGIFVYKQVMYTILQLETWRHALG